ncbi:gamma-glutamylcyclotransferase family protein [Citrifermentans bremense]|uniref:gamma-glutamylcyclotransferase family protein n=1 Tax=Citrifermentans bremense TaxID=60035 RepID=UPI0004299EAE|nr:gamma-glutamylcyclotransferase family protein [Citrifermentans bremense]
MKPYFAYGSNLWLKQMRSRCPGFLTIGAGVLIGYRWIITTRGYASVVRSVADVVFGTVYALSEEDESSLDQFEGVPQGHYRKELLVVETERGKLRCLVYVDPMQQEGAPHEEYLSRLRNGIRDAAIPPQYVEKYLSAILV